MTFQWFYPQDDRMIPACGWTVEFVDPYSLLPLTPFCDKDLDIPQYSYKVYLNSKGEADIYLDPEISYRMTVRNPNGIPIYLENLQMPVLDENLSPEYEGLLIQ